MDTEKISKIQLEIDEKLKQVYSNLDPMQKTLVADMKKDQNLNFL